MDTPHNPADNRPPERPPAEVRTAESMQEFNVDRAMNTPGFVAFLGAVENAADMDMTDANKDEIKEHFAHFQTQQKVDRMLRRPGFKDFLDAHDDKDTFGRTYANAEELEARLQTFEKCKAVSRDLRTIFTQKLATEKTGRLTAEEVKGFDKYVYGEGAQSPERLVELANELALFKQLPQGIAQAEAEMKRLATKKTGMETAKVTLEKKKELAEKKREERATQLEKSWWAEAKSIVFGTGLPKMDADIQKLDADIATAQALLASHPKEEDTRRFTDGLRTNFEDLRQKVFADVPVAEKIHKRIADEFGKQLDKAFKDNSLTAIQATAAKFTHFETLAERGDASNYLDLGGAVPFDRNKFREDLEEKVKELVSAGIMKTLGELPAGSTQRRLETALRTYTRMAEKGFGLSGPAESKELVLTLLQEHEQTLKKEKGGLEKAILARRLIAKLEGTPDSTAVPPVISTVHGAPASATATAGPERASVGTAVVTPIERPARTAPARTMETPTETGGFSPERRNHHKIGDLVMRIDRYGQYNVWNSPREIISFSDPGDGGKLLAQFAEDNESVRVDLLVPPITPLPSESVATSSTSSAEKVIHVPFTEVTKLPQDELEQVLRGVDPNILAVAFSQLTPGERGAVLDAVSPDVAGKVTDKIGKMRILNTPTPLEIEKAQSMIVEVATKLATEKKISSFVPIDAETSSSVRTETVSSAPTPARAETAPSTPRAPEQPPKPETFTFIVSQDTNVSPEEKKATMEKISSSEDARNYARGLEILMERVGEDAVRALASGMVRDLKNVLAKVGVSVSPQGESKSWALWDIGKQEYLVRHPEQAGPHDTIGSAFSNPEKKVEVINRQIGGEVYGGFKGKVGIFEKNLPAFFSKVRPENLPEVRALLNEKPDEDGLLPPHRLARLGALVRGDITGLSVAELPPEPPAKDTAEAGDAGENPLQAGTNQINESEGKSDRVPAGIDVQRLKEARFGDIVHFDVETRQKIIRKAGPVVVATALSGLATAGRYDIFKSISPRLEGEVRDEVNLLSEREMPVSGREIGIAQDKMAEIARSLALEGEKASTGIVLETKSGAVERPENPVGEKSVAEGSSGIGDGPEGGIEADPLGGTSLEETSGFTLEQTKGFKIGTKVLWIEGSGMKWKEPRPIEKFWANDDADKTIFANFTEPVDDSGHTGLKLRALFKPEALAGFNIGDMVTCDGILTHPSQILDFFVGGDERIYARFAELAGDPKGDGIFVGSLTKAESAIAGANRSEASSAETGPTKESEDVDSQTPDWLKGNFDQLYATAERTGLVSPIRILCARRKTAAEITKLLKLDDENIVKAVRFKEGIPSMTVGAGASQSPNPEFEEWLQRWEENKKRVGNNPEGGSGTEASSAETGSHTPEQIELKTFTDLEKLPDADLERVVKMGAAPYIWGCVVQDLPGSEVSESFVAKVRQFLRDQGAFDRGKASVQSGESIRRDRAYTVEDARKQLSPKSPEENAS